MIAIAASKLQTGDVIVGRHYDTTELQIVESVQRVHGPRAIVKVTRLRIYRDGSIGRSAETVDYGGNEYVMVKLAD